MWRKRWVNCRMTQCCKRWSRGQIQTTTASFRRRSSTTFWRKNIDRRNAVIIWNPHLFNIKFKSFIFSAHHQKSPSYPFLSTYQRSNINSHSTYSFGFSGAFSSFFFGIIASAFAFLNSYAFLFKSFMNFSFCRWISLLCPSIKSFYSTK